jgi:quinol monooxygenase YgiN
MASVTAHEIAMEEDMVMTVLEARVAPDRVAGLELAYREAIAALPPGIVETFLARDTRDPSVFRITTVWVDRAALDAMRASGATTKGVQIFQDAGAAPDLTILDVVVHRRG